MAPPTGGGTGGVAAAGGIPPLMVRKQKPGEAIEEFVSVRRLLAEPAPGAGGEYSGWARVVGDDGEEDREIAFSAGGRYVAVALQDGHVAVWDLHPVPHAALYLELPPQLTEEEGCVRQLMLFGSLLRGWVDGLDGGDRLAVLLDVSRSGPRSTDYPAHPHPTPPTHTQRAGGRLRGDGPLLVERGTEAPRHVPPPGRAGRRAHLQVGRGRGRGGGALQVVRASNGVVARADVGGSGCV